ncbi:TlpA family protein disulfide reductase [Winogradskyella bathintestinalis]|uniref:TlpA disulfide reductase family protein n=1 Tax=Winogradskyella bathintestinalis TaxID=3035208 RepID=A0ABT7ZU93_9FLAO|nr:TlpA disulfide reductase family protein [Winogradskyella bathintestinalis]MDN3492587.1 TlpA disulfide reductase family protein [Winogradskyella bathintestinalis]
MKHLFLILLILVIPFQNDKLEVYDYDGLEPLINKNDGKIHVVNFWATWCAPCIKELPYFEAINDKYKDGNVEVLLVSLDFPNKYDTTLKPFIKKKNLKSKVVALDDTDQNRWIPAIDKNWSGALPATIIYKGDKRQFYERSFTQEELEAELQKFLKL